MPAIIGFAAVLKNLSDLADARTLVPALAGAVGAQVVLSIFLAGGVLDRLARDRAVGAHAFFAACGAWFWRFLRLGRHRAGRGPAEQCLTEPYDECAHAGASTFVSGFFQGRSDER